MSLPRHVFQSLAVAKISRPGGMGGVLSRTILLLHNLANQFYKIMGDCAVFYNTVRASVLIQCSPSRAAPATCSHNFAVLTTPIRHKRLAPRLYWTLLCVCPQFVRALFRFFSWFSCVHHIKSIGSICPVVCRFCTSITSADKGSGQSQAT